MTGRLASPMNHSFKSVPVPRLQRSVFDRSHGYKTAFDPDYLIPYYVDEVLPGDTINLESTIFGRVIAMVFPIMDNLHMDTHFFYVPTRLLWTHWEAFNGAQENPDDPIDYQVPVLTGEGDALEVTANDIGDYMGLPPGILYEDDDKPISLPMRAYNFIWNQWFRDENMQDSVPFPTGDGPDDYGTNFRLLKRGKRFDYFTSCLPDPQKGPDIYIPLGDTAPVDIYGTGESLGLMTSGTPATQRYGIYVNNGTTEMRMNTNAYDKTLGSAIGTGTPALSSILGVTDDATASGLTGEVDLASVTGISVNDLREAMAFQHVLERDMRGGTRYVEHILAHWGVEVPDFRLQRPEYLGGSSQMINISTVPQTSPSPAAPDLEDAQGRLSGYGSVTDRVRINKTFVEHGYIIGLVSVRADLTYQQGMRRMWSRKNRFDFALPDLMHLGEQPVYMREIYMVTSDPVANAAVFGYQERYAEYRYFPSGVTGPMRSSHPQSLDAWHLALEFGGTPALDTNFIQSSTPISRVVAIPSQPTIMFDSFQKIKHARAMPVYAIPGLRRL